MDSKEVGDLLEECLKAAKEDQQLSEAQRIHHCSVKDSLCAELASLLQEAMDMKWPFVPEKWQYKQSVSANDKTNLSDLISQHLPQLLAFLKACIKANEIRSALAIIFLMDRYLYWIDESSQLLKLTRRLHSRHRDIPIAPQLVIRQARVYLNQGKLQKAEYILSSLINNPNTTGSWKYQSESDRALVQAVSVQVRGMILQKLGLWLGAAELIWASLVGFYSLPQPDKKGIGTSLGILANILVSMNDEDFRAFSCNPDIDFSFLGSGGHRLLSAAEAAKMAVVYSQYTSLYVLTNVVTQGNCLLSYSFSVDCPSTHKQPFLLQAREAFAIGLLTKAEAERVTSQQELHTFIKAAYSLAITHKWLGTPLEVVDQAAQACQEALAHFYDYCHANTQEKDTLCSEIMHLIGRVKLLLQVEPFLNSDKGSFIPDSYRNVQNASVTFTLEGFSKIMKRFQKYHESLSEIPDTKCKGTKDEADGPRLCITALGTTATSECSTEACKLGKDLSTAEKPQQRGSSSFPPNMDSTVGSTDPLGSSWQHLSLSLSVSPQSNSSGYKGSSTTGQGLSANNQSCITTEEEAIFLQSADQREKLNLGHDSGITSHPALSLSLPATSSSDVKNSDRFELLQAETEDDDYGADIVAQKPVISEGDLQSLSQLILNTSSSSLGDSFGSKSSWEKMSADLNCSSSGKPHRVNLSEAGTSRNSKSQDSDGSFFLLETANSETSDSALDHQDQNHSSAVQPSSKLPPVIKNFHAPSNTQTANNNSYATPSHFSPSGQQTARETSSDSSFEMLDMNRNQHNESILSEKVTVKVNPLCFSCLNHVSVADRRQFVLSQQDFRALLAGVCHECLVKRLHSDETLFKLKTHKTVSSALHLKFSKASGLWTAKETCVYIGEPMEKQGKQREAIWVQFLHQEERLSSYVGKDYLKPEKIIFHLKDVERQMTAQHYVTEFNKSLYDKEVMAQIFFIPSEALLILDGDKIVGCLTVEPYMLGDFVKLTNNTTKINPGFQATEYGLAFGHFTFLLSEGQEVVVDLQGWVTANGKGLTYLTDPQIHSTMTPKGQSNFAERGLRYFVEEQHGPKCNEICQLLKLPSLGRWPKVLPQKR